MLRLFPLSLRGFIIIALCATLAGSLGLAAALKVASPGDDRTALRSARAVFSLRYDDDSWMPLKAAVAAWRESPSKDIYAQTFEAGTKFQYPPTALFVAMGPTEPSGGTPYIYLDMVSIGFLVLTFLAVERIFAFGTAAGAPGPEPLWATPLRLSLVAGAGLMFYPLSYGLNLGQAQVWIDGLFALAVLAWMRGGRVAPGVLIALASLLKPQLSLFLVWALLRGEWRFALALGAAGFAGLCAAVLVFGLDDLLAYVRVLGFIAERGEAFHANQSINGLLNRLMSLSDPVAFNNLQWRAEHFPPPNGLVRLGTTLSSLVILGLALLNRRRAQDDPGRLLDFCTMALSATLASPIAWEHHYGVCFPIFAVLLLALRASRIGLALLAVSYLAIGQYVGLFDLTAATLFNPLQSYVLFGGLILLGLLHTTRTPSVVQAPGLLEPRHAKISP